MATERHIGLLVTAIRDSKDMTKAELARRAGVSAPYLTQIESGDRRPSKAVLMRIAGALEVPNYKLLEPAGFTFDSGAYFENIDRAVAWLKDRLHGDELIYFEGIIRELPELAQWVSSGPAVPNGPDGWDDLTTDDQRIVQLLINRLRSEQPE